MAKGKNKPTKQTKKPKSINRRARVRRTSRKGERQKGLVPNRARGVGFNRERPSAAKRVARRPNGRPLR